MTDTPKPKYASFNMRVLAASIDLLIVTLVSEPITDWLVAAIYPQLDLNMVAAQLTAALGDPNHMVAMAWKTVRDNHLIGRVLAMNLPQLVLIALYTLPFWLKYSSTPGKMLFGFSIRDAVTGERMTSKQAEKRFLGYFVSGIGFTLGFMWVMFDKKNQGWHDKIADTVVVKVPKKEKKIETSQDNSLPS